MTITAAADGSALGNPGPAGWAWYVNDDCWRAGGWPHGTNNQGELMAVLDLFRATAHVPDEELRVLCDSQYVINSITKWMPGWKRKGWRKADGKPVLNVELLRNWTGNSRAGNTPSNGSKGMRATTSTRPPMTAPGLLPRRTSRVSPPAPGRDSLAPLATRKPSVPLLLRLPPRPTLMVRPANLISSVPRIG